jgi:hypothetical protein
MYAQKEATAPPSWSSGATLGARRAVLRTRPMVQRILIRSWEYIRPVRITILAIRMLVVLWLLFGAGALMSAGYAWGWALLPVAAGVAAFSAWVFTTAAKGWPVAGA